MEHCIELLVRQEENGMLDIKLSGRIQCLLAVAGFKTAKAATTYVHYYTVDCKVCTEQSRSMQNYPTA